MKGRKRRLIKSRPTGEESQLLLASCASATLGVKDIKGWDRPKGNTARAPRRGLCSREAETNKKD